jgi:hypothetical protein
MRVDRDGLGLGVFATLACGGLYVCYDAAGRVDRPTALVAMGVFLVMAVLACHFLLNLMDRFDKWREQAIDTDSEDESKDLEDAVVF